MVHKQCHRGGATVLCTQNRGKSEGVSGNEKKSERIRRGWLPHRYLEPEHSSWINTEVAEAPPLRRVVLLVPPYLTVTTPILVSRRSRALTFPPSAPPAEQQQTARRAAYTTVDKVRRRMGRSYLLVWPGAGWAMYLLYHVPPAPRDAHTRMQIHTRWHVSQSALQLHDDTRFLTHRRKNDQERPTIRRQTARPTHPQTYCLNVPPRLHRPIIQWHLINRSNHSEAPLLKSNIWKHVAFIMSSLVENDWWLGFNFRERPKNSNGLGHRSAMRLCSISAMRFDRAMHFSYGWTSTSKCILPQ